MTNAVNILNDCTFLKIKTYYGFNNGIVYQETSGNIITVMPVKTGIQEAMNILDSGVRRNDECCEISE